MNLREELFSALADAFPTARVSYYHEHGAMIFSISEYIEVANNVLSLRVDIMDAEAVTSILTANDLAAAYAKAARADWDRKLASAKAAA